MAQKEKLQPKEEKEKKVVEKTDAYYPGMVVASREMAESKKGGISKFNIKTGKTDSN